MSLAKTIAATHEPGKWKLKEFADFAKSGFTNVVVNDYIATMKSEVIDGNNIVDARLSFIMPLVLDWFPGANWVIVYRSPVDTVRSWLERGGWHNAETRHDKLHPLGGWLDIDELAYMGAWTWNVTYRMILAATSDKFEYWNCDRDLDVRLNTGPDTYELDSWGTEAIWDECSNVYNELERLRRDCVRPVFDHYQGNRHA